MSEEYFFFFCTSVYCMLRIAFHNKRQSRNSQDTTYTFPGNLPKLSVNRLICELSSSCPQKHNKIAWVTQRPTQSPIRSPLEQGQTDRLAQGGDLSSRHVDLSAARPAPSHTSRTFPRGRGLVPRLRGPRRGLRLRSTQARPPGAR